MVSRSLPRRSATPCRPDALILSRRFVPALVLLSAGALLGGHVALAQTTSPIQTVPAPTPQTTPAPATPPATSATPGTSTAPSAPVQTVPAPTPAPAPTPSAPGAVQSIPAATPVSPDTVHTVPGYQDPLEQPLVVKPGVATIPPPTTVEASTVNTVPPYNPLAAGPEKFHTDHLGSTYIPVDSIIYPMALRLYSMGYLDTAFIDLRPWTRRSLLHMLDQSSERITADGNDEAIALLARLQTYLTDEGKPTNNGRGTVYGIESVYTRMLGIQGQTLRDSFHLGQTIDSDYGRPYEPGFNNITGFSSVNEHGRFSLYVRGEYEHSPSGTGYYTTPTGNPYAPNGLAEYLSQIDAVPYPGTNNYNLNQATIPSPIIAAQNPFRLQEATLSFHFLGHEISGGKSDAWLGPAMGSALAWSNNAEDIYSFRINRVEPLHIPLLSRLTGPFRYDFFVGSLKGHTDPNSPWVHQEMFSFAPTKNVEIAFQRTVIWGGEGHEPITLHTFLRSFFSFNDTASDPSSKHSPQDPGARFSDFSFSWRLPFLRHYVTLYTDSESHDDVSPPSAPRRAGYRPGVYISQFPGLRKLDFRIEGANTDVSTTISQHGQAEYVETIQVQGYTNKGFIMGDWIGRQAKGGQAWLTYHLGPDEWIQLEYLEKKTPVGFIAGGTTQGQFKVDVVKRIHKDVELNAWVQYERWKAPIYIMNPNGAANIDNVIAAQFTWHPKLRIVGINGK
jgi:hypothetical protein